MSNAEARQILSQREVFGAENVSTSLLGTAANLDELAYAIVDAAKFAWQNGRVLSLIDCGVLQPMENWSEPRVDPDAKLIEKVRGVLASAPMLRAITPE